MIVDLAGEIVTAFIIAPVEWAAERLWRVHRKEPTWWRVLSAIVLSLITCVMAAVYFALVIGIPIAIILLVVG